MPLQYLLQHYLEKWAKRLPDKTALICGDERLTYAEINERADRLASALSEMAVQRQDRVAIFLDNSVESVISLYGILKAGGTFIMLSATMKPKKLRYILIDSGAKVLVSHPGKARIVKKALHGHGGVEHVLWCATEETPSFQPANHRSFNDILNTVPDPDTLRRADTCLDVDLATIIYTSGSTGDPKGVMSAHFNVISAARSITTYLENVEDDIILCALPLSFDYGLYQVLMAFMFGGTVVLERSFVFPYRVLERLVREKATGFPLVPTMAALLLQMEDLSRFNFDTLRYISNTAAALHVSHIRKLQRLFPGAKIYSMYGLTECKRVSYLPPEELAERPDSVGIAMPNTEVFVVDDDGKEVGPGEPGQLVIRGSNVMQGYWNAPKETTRRYKPGRYRGETLLYSGDIFRKDDEGFLYFVGRMDDMIKTKGERVSPKEIEDCLCEIEGVMEAAVIGISDDILGQAIKAFIVTHEAEKITGEIVLRHCQLNLEPFMVPKHVEFLDEFAKTSTGKIDKKRLR